MANWIQDMHMKKGAFTAQAEKRGQSVQGFAKKVTKHPDNYSAKTARRAALARTFAKMNKG
jgi:hypothetical protein